VLSLYSYLKGLVTEIKATSITLDVNDVGFLIKTPSPFAFQIDSRTTVYTHQHVREDAIELYGFRTSDERDMFLKLINVKGLGPKGSMAILASATVPEIVSAINSEQAKFFERFPGIGAKLSQQIILDLRGKVNFQATGNVEKTDDRQYTVEQALKGLGYKAAEIKAMLKELPFDKETSISDLIKMALRKTL
jgi:Holliday junction DNA helicase RuvA